ncbi:hypothetical protein NM688_g8585 [Phlebia brevispora]|uniref:Uncharacterized protein n=1 Tax=Phlebia brevispora TaxID=194682 RepID=A0ACC1RRY6_9APHY|nr:hypothetical protein NM688_g8585 [Phlebia brevispora]
MDADPYSYIDAFQLDDEFDFSSQFEEEDEADSWIGHAPICVGGVCSSTRRFAMPVFSPGCRHRQGIGMGRAASESSRCDRPVEYQYDEDDPFMRLKEMMGLDTGRKTACLPDQTVPWSLPHPPMRGPPGCSPPDMPRFLPSVPRPDCSESKPKHPKHPHLPKLPHPKPVYSLNATLPTLLSNHTLHVHVAQFHSILPRGGYITKLFVNGQWVVAADVPTRNGAVHVVNSLIRPFHKGHHGHHGDHGYHFDEEAWFEPSADEENFDDDVDDGIDHEWDDWEEWLPQWANED